MAVLILFWVLGASALISFVYHACLYFDSRGDNKAFLGELTDLKKPYKSEDLKALSIWAYLSETDKHTHKVWAIAPLVVLVCSIVALVIHIQVGM